MLPSSSLFHVESRREIRKFMFALIAWNSDYWCQVIQNRTCIFVALFRCLSLNFILIICTVVSFWHKMHCPIWWEFFWALHAAKCLHRSRKKYAACEAFLKNNNRRMTCNRFCACDSSTCNAIDVIVKLLLVYRKSKNKEYTSNSIKKYLQQRLTNSYATITHA